MNCLRSLGRKPVTVAARSKAWTVFARSNASRSRWPPGLRHELFSAARTLGSWIRIPLKTWMSVCVYSLLVFLCIGIGLATGWSPSKESYCLSIGLRNWKRGQGPTKRLQSRRYVDRQVLKLIQELLCAISNSLCVIIISNFHSQIWLQSWGCKRYISPRCWYLPTRLWYVITHGPQYETPPSSRNSRS
jgi:hypothetical protein